MVGDELTNRTVVGPLRWEALNWQDFLQELELYRDRFMRGAVNDQELPYIRCWKAFEGRSTVERAARVEYLLDFLNAWECRLNRATAGQVLPEWIRAKADRFDALQDVRIDDEDLPERVDEIDELYSDLMTLRTPDGLHNWSDACASKMLNQFAPSAFVMWDNKIKAYAAGQYQEFMFSMHRLARRLVEESPANDGPGLDAFLQDHLGYKIRKSLAKYLDEYNWHVAVGRGYPERRGGLGSSRS